MYADLEHCTVTKLVDDTLYAQERYGSLDDLNQAVLSNLDFDKATVTYGTNRKNAYEITEEMSIFALRKRSKASIFSGFLHSSPWFGPRKFPRYFQA